jgi:hypothetical protein
MLILVQIGLVHKVVHIAFVGLLILMVTHWLSLANTPASATRRQPKPPLPVPLGG